MKEVIPKDLNSIISTAVNLDVVRRTTLMGLMPDMEKSEAMEIEQVHRLMDTLDEIDSLIKTLDSVSRDQDLENLARLPLGAINEGEMPKSKKHTNP